MHGAGVGAEGGCERKVCGSIAREECSLLQLVISATWQRAGACEGADGIHVKGDMDR